MDPKFLLAIMLLLHTPTVFGCVNFYAYYHVGANLGDPYPLKVSLVDNGDEECTYDGTPNDGSLYSFGCSAGYTATMDPNSNGGQGSVSYNPPWGSFNFATNYTPPDNDDFTLGSYDAEPYC